MEYVTCNRQIFGNQMNLVKFKKILDNDKKIKLLGKKSDYDCLIGLSGGVDSYM